MTQDITISAAAETTQEAPAPSGWWRKLVWLGPTGLLVGVTLSVIEWLLVNGQENQAGPIAATAAVAMTAPVVLARRWPVASAAAIAVAAVLNGLVFGELVRCGGAFPAAVYIAFIIGAYARTSAASWAAPVAGIVLVIANLAAQFFWDSALRAGGAAFLLFGPGVALAAWAGGLGVAALRTRRSAR